jgi:hypothetical protein
MLRCRLEGDGDLKIVQARQSKPRTPSNKAVRSRSAPPKMLHQGEKLDFDKNAKAILSRKVCHVHGVTGKISSDAC